MAPWASRILSPNSRRDESGQNAAGPSMASPARTRHPSGRLTEADILDNAYGVPTLLPSTKASSSHTRSMSHPFPSLFTSKKSGSGKKSRDLGAESGDDAGVVSPALVRQTAQNPTAKQQVKVADKDLTTGKCITCDSMVRWPKELKVFRCTVCLTINDLKPVILEVRRGDGHRAPASMKPGNHHPGSPISQRSMLFYSFAQTDLH